MTDASPWMARWNLNSDGAPIETHTGVVLPVRRDGVPMMLKISTEPEERNGAHLMVWWEGVGAAQVFAHDADALLMERAMGDGDLWAMSRAGRDDDTVRILVAATLAMHQPRPEPPPKTLIPLHDRFAALWRNESAIGGFYAQAAEIARGLIEHPLDQAVLHGDVQHHNLLDFGDRGWCFIDPKGLLGESLYDFANIFCNPDEETAQRPGLVSHRADLVANLTGCDRTRLLQWVVAYCGLSASWHLEDETDPSHPLTIGASALADLGDKAQPIRDV